MTGKDDVTGAAGKPPALVVGAGPAGLMAAEAMAEAGLEVVVCEAMPSPARKFLMAGKSGLNLTKEEPEAAFLARYHGSVPVEGAVRDFGPDAVSAWARGLGQEVFAGSTGRVFPVAMKASPLLRAWLGRLGALGVELRTRWRWTGWDGDDWVFATAEGERRMTPGVAVVALGGASWPRLGSDGGWVAPVASVGVGVAAFRPANMGFRVEWSEHIAPMFGRPVKGTALTAGDAVSRGEWVISDRGIEGGGVYEVSRAVRDGAALTIDLMPDLTVGDLATRLGRPGRKASVANRLRKAGLGEVERALLMEWGRPLPEDPADLAGRIKALAPRLSGAMSMEKAISTAGGIAGGALDGWMLRARPGVFAAGEMLDWEAPTGGYLLTACLATGRAAGAAAAAWLAEREGA